MIGYKVIRIKNNGIPWSFSAQLHEGGRTYKEGKAVRPLKNCGPLAYCDSLQEAIWWMEFFTDGAATYMDAAQFQVWECDVVPDKTGFTWSPTWPENKIVPTHSLKLASSIKLVRLLETRIIQEPSFREISQ